jgi:PilZ domain-containing protein
MDGLHRPRGSSGPPVTTPHRIVAARPSVPAGAASLDLVIGRDNAREAVRLKPRLSPTDIDGVPPWPEIARKLVHIRVGARRDLIAPLLELGSDSIVIGCPRNEEESYVPELSQPVEVGLITDEGVVWYRGAVSELEPRGERSLRVRVGEDRARPEQRANPRAPYSLSVDVTVPGTLEPVPGRLVDVSEGGVRLTAPLDVRVGDIVGVTVHMPGGQPFQATARVVHVHSALSGFQFELALASDRERLVRHAFERLAFVGGGRLQAPTEASRSNSAG